RPDTNIISDKNRIATSKNPTIDRKTLQELRDSARPGAPGRGGAPARPSPPSASPAAAAQPSQMSQPSTAQRQPGQTGVQTPAQNTQTEAKLETPPLGGNGGKGAFNIPTSAGSAIQAATRAAAATRGGFGGSGGDYGVGIPRSQGMQSNLDILSDTMGVDFGPYLARVLHDVRLNWYNLIPEVARAPIMKKGKVC